MNYQPRFPAEAEAFKNCFSGVASFLGRPSAPTVLFSGIPIGPSSVTIEEIEFVANRVGIEAKIYTRTDFLRHRVELPAIVFLANRLPVALLSERDRGDFVTVPQDGGRTSFSRKEILDGEVTNIVGFSLTYTNSGEHAGAASTIDRRHWLTGTLAPFWRSYVQVGLAACFINLVALASPLFVMNVYDRILPNKAVSSLWVLAIGVSISILFDLLLKTARASLIDYAGRKADLRISYLLFEKVLNSTLAARPLSTGEYANRVSQYEFVREFFTSNTISVLIDTLFVFVFLFVIHFLAGWLVVIPSGAFVVAVIIGLVAQHRIGKRIATAMNESSQRQALLVESISTLETIKALQAEAYLLRKWREHSKNAAKTSEGIKQLSAVAANLTQFVQQLVTVLLVVAGAYAFAAGDMTTGAIIAVVMLSGRAVAPLSQIAITLSRLRQAMLSLRILNDIMSQPEDLPDTVGFVNRPVSNGVIEFRDVTFAYPGTEAKALKGLSFHVSAGERVGIIGRIGSGKTTIGRLLGRLYLPTAGDLLIDGIDVRQYHPAEIRKVVGIAGQTGDLFSGTVKENLLMARPDASDEEIVAVARLAGVDEFVSNHPRGYDMNVGERGNSLSGGQKQAVAIARLLLAQPRIVFLDEPSSSMDLASERLLLRHLSQAFDRQTTIIVSTHRFSMLELVDRLIVIDQGRLIADGPKEQVLQALAKSSAEAAANAKPAQTTAPAA